MNEYRDEYSKKLLRDAKISLETAREFENSDPTVWEKFILGKSTFAVLSRNPETGRPEHNIWAVMETIYDDYRNNPDQHIDTKLQTILNEALLNEQNSIYLKNAIEILLYQMRSEKQNSAAFALDCVTLLKNLRTNVTSNREKLEINNMIEDITEYNEILKEHYSTSILS